MNSETEKSIDLRLPLALLLLIYILIGLGGYGNDCDTYLMIRSGRQFINGEGYQFSRPPGYLVPELIIGITSQLGPHWLSNAVSALLAVASLYIFHRILSIFLLEKSALLLVLCVAFNPWFVLAATTSIDYIYSLFFILLVLQLLIDGRPLMAAPATAAALSSRPGNALLILALYLYFLFRTYRYDKPSLFRLVGSAFLALLLTLALFFPSYRSVGYSFDFFSYAAVEWSLLGHASRFLYKNLFLFGLLPTLWLLVCTWKNRIFLQKSNLGNPENLFVMAAILLHSMLFFKIPLEISYQLPLLLLIFPLLARHFNFSRKQLLILLMLNLFTSFVLNIDLLDKKYNPDNTEAVSATPGIFFRPGIVVDDFRRRPESTKQFFDKYQIDLN
ncbi:MAG: hypothetical protein ACOYXC_05335 [Candidatus Rifleibacteriota bacterium]